MKKKRVLNPNYVLIFFILFIILFVSINYIGYQFFQLDEYTYEKLVKTFNIFCFIPGTFIFLGISIYNFSISKSDNNKRHRIVSLIPLCIVLLFYFYVIIMLLYVFIRDIGKM
ncbi:hypothetical protein ASG22_20480 [Chryseobacterium sp. Leaf405]|nr:hypothetical protein ASG22_20480 [Chryseobacterium sp. Leaf405]